MSSIPSLPFFSRDDIKFGPAEGFLILGVPLIVRFQNEQLTIRDETVRWEAEEKASPGAEGLVLPEIPDGLIWTGSLAEARFLYEGTPTLDTLKDQQGNVLWSKATERTSPDLLLESSESGQAKLTGKGGRLLWEGTLPPRKDREIRNPTTQDMDRARRMIDSINRDIDVKEMARRKMLREVHGAGVHVSGDNGAFTVTYEEGRLLWSGTLRRKAVILLRRGAYCAFMGRLGSSTGIEQKRYQTRDIGFEWERCEVTVTDFFGNVLFTFPQNLLKCAPKHLLTESQQFPELQARADASGHRLVWDSLPMRDIRFISPSPPRDGRGRKMFLFIFKDSNGKEVLRCPYLVKVKE